MNILNRAIMFAFERSFGITGGSSYSNQNVAYQEAQRQQPVVKGSTFLEDLYRLAYGILSKILKLMNFPHVSDANSGGRWINLWNAAHGCFAVMLEVAIPIATIFFIIGIYKSVIDKAPEEQPKQFFQDVVRYTIILFIISNLFNFLTLITQISDGVTDEVMSVDGMNPTSDAAQSNVYDIKYDTSPIKTVIDYYSGGMLQKTTKSYEKKPVLDFFLDVFEYITLLFGGVATIIIFAVAGYTIIMAVIVRVVKPLAMLPFSTIVVGMAACSGEGERTISQFIKKLLGFSLSGVFIIIALKLGAAIACMNLFDLNKVMQLDSNSLISAIVGIINVNIPVIITTGLVRASENFMDKIFA